MTDNSLFTITLSADPKSEPKEKAPKKKKGAFNTYESPQFNYFPIINVDNYMVLNCRQDFSSMNKILDVFDNLNIFKMGLMMFDFPTIENKEKPVQFVLDFSRMEAAVDNQTNKFCLIIPVRCVYGLDVHVEDDDDEMDREEGIKEMSEIYNSLIKKLSDEFGTAFPDINLAAIRDEDGNIAETCFMFQMSDSDDESFAEEEINKCFRPLLRFIKNQKLRITYILTEN